MDAASEQRTTEDRGDSLSWYTISVADALAALGTDAGSGLSHDEVGRRRERFGHNRFVEAPPEPAWKAFVRQYRDLMQLVLVGAAIAAFYPVREYGTAILLVVITVFNALLGMRQEGKAAAAVAALSKMMVITVRVRRAGELQTVPAEELVPGDVVLLEAGDVVPADGRVVKGANLEVDESALTGESVPVAKETTRLVDPATPLAERSNLLYMNTSVTRGSGTMVVTSTGMATEVGHISDLLGAEKAEKTPLTRQLDTLVRQILVIAGVALVVSIALNMSRGQTLTEVFAASVAFAIAAIPEELPAVVTAILAKGTKMLADAGAILKQLRSTETLGSTSAINSDKTGTLTLNQMTAVRLALVDRRYNIEGSGYSTEGRITRVAGEGQVDLDRFLLPMVLASDAEISDGELIGDPTEGALVVLATKGGVDPDATRRAYPRLGVLPFDASYKLMATFHQMHEHEREVVRCYVKGAPDQLLAHATSYVGAGLEVNSLDEDDTRRYLHENRRLGEEGLRVLATAYRDVDPSEFHPETDLLAYVSDLTLLAMVGIVDPPRPQAKTAIARAKAAGIRVRMITGDHLVTAQTIAMDLGIEGQAITGQDFSALSDAEAAVQIDEIGVLARVTPEDKVRLVDILRRQGEVVAMTGDGVNDAPALKRADIGVAMGITGTEVSKEAADMILTDDDFATIVKAVEYGRGLYDDLTRYIRFQIGCLFGIIVSFLGASIFNVAQGVPFLPLQTLWINFTVILSQAIGLGYGKPSEHLMEQPPRDTEAPVLDAGRLASLAAVGAVMGVVTLSLLSWATSAHGETVARTMGLTSFLVAVVLLSFESRDEIRSAFSLDVLADRTFMVATGISVSVIWLGTTIDPLERLLDTVPLDLNQWLICIGAAAWVLVVTESRKLIARRRALSSGGRDLTRERSDGARNQPRT
jgi:Ca2+-transporting ATPase